MRRSATEIREILAEVNPPGLVVPDHNEQGHFYVHTPTGLRCASVTTKSGILDAPHLKKWAAGLAVDRVFERVDVKPLASHTREERDLLRHESILVHQDLFEEAGAIGTEGHGILEDYMKVWMETGVQPADIRTFVKREDSRLYNIARSAEMFFNDFEVIPIASEMKIFHTTYKFGGTLDALIVYRKEIIPGIPGVTDLFGEPHKVHNYLWLNEYLKIEECVACGRRVQQRFCLLDFKTSNSIDHAEYAMQTSAYHYSLRHMSKGRIVPEDILILRLDKNSLKYEVMRVVNPFSAFKAFLNVTKVYDWLNDDEAALEKFTGRKKIALTSLAGSSPSVPITGSTMEEIT